MHTLTITRPDDWHLHLRDGAEMASVLAHTERVFARAIVMPNLRPPVTTTAMAAAYRERVRSALPKGSAFSASKPIALIWNASSRLTLAIPGSNVVIAFSFR